MLNGFPTSLVFISIWYHAHRSIGLQKGTNAHKTMEMAKRFFARQRAAKKHPPVGGFRFLRKTEAALPHH